MFGNELVVLKIVFGNIQSQPYLRQISGIVKGGQNKTIMIED
jgi:hypothetical protein